MLPKNKRRYFLTEAYIFLFISETMIRWCSPKFIFSIAQRNPRLICRFNADEIQWTSWAIVKVAERRRKAPPDLAYALAAQMMLFRRGVPSRLCVGMSRGSDGNCARIWLECDDQIVIGRANTANTTCISSFGG
jgi:hypothetical protein